VGAEERVHGLIAVLGAAVGLGVALVPPQVMGQYA
jgi:hypothetical protein